MRQQTVNTDHTKPLRYTPGKWYDATLSCDEDYGTPRPGFRQWVHAMSFVLRFPDGSIQPIYFGDAESGGKYGGSWKEEMLEFLTHIFGDRVEQFISRGLPAEDWLPDWASIAGTPVQVQFSDENYGEHGEQVLEDIRLGAAPQRYVDVVNATLKMGIEDMSEQLLELRDRISKVPVDEQGVLKLTAADLDGVIRAIEPLHAKV